MTRWLIRFNIIVRSPYGSKRRLPKISLLDLYVHFIDTNTVPGEVCTSKLFTVFSYKVLGLRVELLLRIWNCYTFSLCCPVEGVGFWLTLGPFPFWKRQWQLCVSYIVRVYQLVAFSFRFYANWAVVQESEVPELKTIGTCRCQGCRPKAPAAFTPQDLFLVGISVGGFVDLRTVVREEGLCLNQLGHHVPPPPPPPRPNPSTGWSKKCQAKIKKKLKNKKI